MQKCKNAKIKLLKNRKMENVAIEENTEFNARHYDQNRLFYSFAYYSFYSSLPLFKMHDMYFILNNDKEQ